MLIQTCGWQWSEPESSACRQLRAYMSSITPLSAHWLLRCMQTVSLHWPLVMELLASGSRTSMTRATSRRRECILFHFLCMYKKWPSFSCCLLLTFRKWNKETFDYLLSCLSSPESIKMGVFLQSGYNLCTEPAPVSKALLLENAQSIWSQR